MPEPAVANLVQVAVTWFDNSVQSSPAVNVFHFRRDTGQDFTATFAEDLNDAVRALAAAELDTVLHAGANIIKVIVKDLSVLNGAAYEFVATTTVGAVSGHAMPAQNAIVVTWKTGQTGRSFRGRTYLPYLAEATNSETGQVEAAAVTQIGVWANLMLELATGSSTTALVVYSRTLDSFAVVQDFRVNNQWDLQRRRRNVLAG